MTLGIDWSAAFNVTAAATVNVYTWLQNGIDVHYLQWLAWVFYPLILTIIIPIFIVLFLYASAIFLYLYGLRHFLRQALKEVVDRGDFWDGARQILAALWDVQGKIWHGEFRLSYIFFSSSISNRVELERVPDMTSVNFNMVL